MPYIRISQGDIYFEEMGIGEPVLFLHNSFSRGISGFAAQINHFQSCYRCIFPDFRGHGRTVSFRDDWSIPGLADDLPEILDGLNIARAHVIGYSIGGGVGLYAANRYPERIRSLVAIGAAGRVTPAVIANAAAFDPEKLPSFRGAAYIDRLTANHRIAHRGNWRHLVSMTIDNWQRYPSLLPTELERIVAPTLLIAGEQDPLVNEQDLIWLASQLPDARYHLVAGAGHGPHTVGEQPDLVNGILFTFLQSVMK